MHVLVYLKARVWVSCKIRVTWNGTRQDCIDPLSDKITALDKPISPLSLDQYKIFTLYKTQSRSKPSKHANYLLLTLPLIPLRNERNRLQ